MSAYTLSHLLPQNGVLTYAFNADKKSTDTFPHGVIYRLK